MGRPDRWPRVGGGARHAEGSHRRGAALLAGATLATVMIAVAVPVSVSATSSGVMAWGWNASGQLGDETSTGPEKCNGEGPSTEPCSTKPVEVKGLPEEVKAIAGGGAHSLALLKSGKVVAWGNNEIGQLGDETSTGPETCFRLGPCSTKPVEVKGLPEGVTAIAGGGFFHSLALLKSGKVMAWGVNISGQLGDETFTGPETCSGVPCSTKPVEVKGLPEEVTAIAGGAATRALLKSGKVMAWGANFYGLLGHETFTGPETCSGVPCSTKPVEVKGLPEGVTAIAGGSHHGLALLKSGKVMAWGWNVSGQLGDETSTGPERCFFHGPCSTKPVEVRGLPEEVKAIAGGATHSLALLKSGKVMTWGWNVSGQLGYETFTGPETCFGVPCSTKAVEVAGLQGVTAIAGGGIHSLALSHKGRHHRHRPSEQQRGGERNPPR
jgi:alpha-tubulin suppressor-like RCC1 family protein